MLKKKWTVGDQAAFFITRVATHKYIHIAYLEKVQRAEIPTGVDGPWDAILILAGSLPEDFVGVKIFEVVWAREDMAAIWKVVTE